MASNNVTKCHLKKFVRLSPGEFEEIEINSKYFFLFLSAKFVIEIRIHFVKEADIHVHKRPTQEYIFKRLS